MIFKNAGLSKNHPRNRQGYALLFVVLVAAIGGMAVVGIAHTVRFETLEVEAKRRELSDRHTVILNAEKVKARTPSN